MRLAATLVMLSITLPSASAQSHWTCAAGEHFEVYTTGGEKVARRALEDFDRVHRYFEQVLHIPPIAGPRTRLIVFNGRDEFAPYASNRTVRAFFQSGVDGDFIVLPSIGGDVFRAVSHEYAHLVSRRTGRHYPLWLDEGLAEYFSTVTSRGAKLQIGAPVQERTRSLGFGVRLMPLEQLFAITRDSADYTSPERSGLFYAQSWSLTHMLLTDDRYKDQSAALLATLAHSEPSAPTLTTIYGKPIDEISKDLRKYALRGNYRTSLIDVELSAGTATSVIRPATDFEAGVVLATLIAANQNRRAEAQTAFDALERQNPNDLTLVESLALFAVRAARIDQARRYLDRAIELKSTNARIYSHAAEWHDRSSTTTEPNVEADALFAKALTLAPSDPEVRIQIAQSLVRQRRGADAIAMLDTIERVPIEYEPLLADTRAAAQKLIRSTDDVSAAAIPFIR